MSKPEVLVIDDDPLARESLQTFLEFEEFSVTTCEKGSAVFELIDNRRFHAILIDYHMPRMNGDELTRLLRPLCPDSLLIGMSSEPREKDFLKAGADAFVNKRKLIHVLIPLLKNKAER